MSINSCHNAALWCLVRKAPYDTIFMPIIAACVVLTGEGPPSLHPEPTWKDAFQRARVELLTVPEN